MHDFTFGEDDKTAVRQIVDGFSELSKNQEKSKSADPSHKLKGVNQLLEQCRKNKSSKKTTSPMSQSSCSSDDYVGTKGKEPLKQSKRVNLDQIIGRTHIVTSIKDKVAQRKSMQDDS